MNYPTSHYFVSQRLKLHYTDWGNTDAPLLLLIHGGKDHCRSWDWVAERLSKDWHVIAPDWRGHGDSAWSPDGNYSSSAFVYDLAQLIQNLSGDKKVRIVAHSMGGAMALRYTGLYPDNVEKLVAIEGLRPLSPEDGLVEDKPLPDRLREWIEHKQKITAKGPKCYSSLDDAYQRMKAANQQLSDEQVMHLTWHGVNQNEDGSYSWKFDYHLNAFLPLDLPSDELHAIWGAITCPTWLMWGEDSWAGNPASDGRLGYFRNAEVISYANAGHWLHHDQLDRFVDDLNNILP
ncbi:Tropinesterase [Zhongshania aliphaticivorans]|uniref:Tropinesterase n=1 Tax=Zhongshania aliphaticivorans TaxID=1470434 RepID=A0A5S9NRH0_9GAMM|nr:alpha/beta hydrolase [Zhongshania aliphaticivorans]CAA0093126.1 Tropinesterase [Zhongshania aliphaticivorans]CAA0110902.1 Tropinesterase [Zhongshania aliphaticivorans]